MIWRERDLLAKKLMPALEKSEIDCWNGKVVAQCWNIAKGDKEILYKLLVEIGYYSIGKES